MSSIPHLLTEFEVAERLRCSTAKVKRLRLSGKLAYLKGRPVLIPEPDLLNFIERQRQKEEAREPKREVASAPTPAPGQRTISASDRAQLKWLQLQNRRSVKQKS